MTEIILPRLDLSHYLHGSPTKRKQFAMGLTESLKAHGFAKVVNHGLSEDHIQQLFQWVTPPNVTLARNIKCISNSSTE
jgi:isopenicillin N synthase-like dioxygenase